MRLLRIYVWWLFMIMKQQFAAAVCQKWDLLWCTYCTPNTVYSYYWEENKQACISQVVWQNTHLTNMAYAISHSCHTYTHSLSVSLSDPCFMCVCFLHVYLVLLCFYYYLQTYMFGGGGGGCYVISKLKNTSNMPSHLHITKCSSWTATGGHKHLPPPPTPHPNIDSLSYMYHYILWPTST